MTEAVYFKGTIVGMVDGNVYITHRNPENFMRKFQGFGISIDVLDLLEKKDVKIIRIVYHGKNGEIVYNIPFAEYKFSNLEFMNEGTDLNKFVNVYKYKSNLAGQQKLSI